MDSFTKMNKKSTATRIMFPMAKEDINKQWVSLVLDQFLMFNSGMRLSKEFRSELEFEIRNAKQAMGHFSNVYKMVRQLSIDI